MKRFSARAQWFRKSVLAALGATVFGAIFLSQLNASAVILESDSQQCRVDVGSTSGVTLSLSAGRCFLTFSNVGSTTWTVPTGVTSFDLLVVAGGGGGGPDGGSGGGSGSMYEATVGLGSNSSPTFTVSIGAGGARGMHTAPPGQTLTAAGSGGSSTFSGALGFSVTTYGGGPGAWPASDWVSGGAGGTTPAVASGQVSLTSARALAGKTGAWARPASPGFAGQNGVNGETSTLFGNVVLGSGGAGAMFDGDTEFAGGSGGTGGGGRGSGGSGTNGQADYFAEPGTNGTGGGGGGGARWGTTALLTISGVQDHHRNGALGGSGIIRVSYAVPDLSIVTSGDGVRVGHDVRVQPVLQLRNSADQNLAVSGVTVTIATNQGAISGNTAVSDANGRVTFTNLRFTSGSLGSTATLTYSAPGYLSATQTVSIQTLSTDITVSSSPSSNGNFVDGVWFANSAAASVVNSAALATQLQDRSVRLEAVGTSTTDGNVVFQADIPVTLTSDRTITLRSTRNTFLSSSSSITASGARLNAVLWSDTDGANGGIVNLQGRATGWNLSTNGGHVAIGGGIAGTTWNSLTIPAGYASGLASGSGSWWGVEFGVAGTGAVRQLINTSNGNVRVYGESRASANVTYLAGIAWEGGLVSTGSGAIELNGRTDGTPSNGTGANYGVAFGANFAESTDIPSISSTGSVSITGTTAATTNDFQGIYIRGSVLSAGSSVITATTDRRVKLDTGNTFNSRINFTSSGLIEVIGSQAFSGASSDRSAVLTSSAGGITVSAAVSSTSGVEFNCSAGAYSNTSAGTLNVAGDLSIKCQTVTLGGNITSAGHVNIEAEGASSDLTANANITLSTAGRNLMLRSKANVFAGTNGQLYQTAGSASGSGGRIVLWSDSDESGQGFIKTGRNITFNSIGGSTTTFTGGGDIHFGGGLDNGAATVVAGRTSGDGLPDGWAISNVSGEMGIWIGNLAASGDVNQMNSGGGKITIFGKNASASDALAFNWTSKVDSGQGQIEIRGDSAGWGVQLNRSGGNDTYSNKSVFTSRSNTHPAISIRGKSTGNSSYMALLGSYGDAGTDNLLIQAVGTGGVELIADGPSNHPALGLQSTAVLSASGKISIDGGTSAGGGEGAIHFGSIYNGAAQGSVQLGGCAVSTCSNSLVPTSTAEVDIIANRVATYSSLNTTVATSGDLLIVPAVGSTAFTDFAGRLTGLNLSSDLGGLQIGRPGDRTVFSLNKAWTIAGPVIVHGDQLSVAANIVTTGANAPITLRSWSSINVGAGYTLQTSGSDLILWASSAGASGSIAIGNSACLNTNASCDSAVSVATGNIIIGGGAAGSTSPTGPVENTTADVNAVSFGTSQPSGIKVLSGGGDISIRGSSASHGVSGFSGFEIRATTGAISIVGSTSTSARQGVRVAMTGTTTIASAKTSGDAISITGSNSSGSANAESNGIGLGLSSATLNISASGGGDIRINGTVTSSGEIQATQLNNTTVTTAGGDVLLSGDWAELNSSRLDASEGGVIQIKSTRHIGISSSTIETSGPVSGSGGEISIWSDSDGNGVGVIHTAGVTCINTINRCNAFTNSGGSDIVLGGGSLAAANPFFPAGGAPAGALHGIRLSDAHGADRTKIWSGGGDITIASKTGTGSSIYGQLWYGGANVNSGQGQVSVINTAGGSTTNATNGLYLNPVGHPITVASTKASGDAIRFISSLANTGNGSSPIRLSSGSNSVRSTISATNGGNIYFEGNASGTGGNTYSFEVSNTDILANTGTITLKGNRGVLINSFNSGSTNFGATAAGNASGNILIEGNRFSSFSTALPVRMKTTGTLTIRPYTGESFLEAITFPRSEIVLEDLTGLNVGASGNNQSITASPAEASSDAVMGNVNYTGSSVAMNHSFSAGNSGNISITASSSYSGTGILSAEGSININTGSTATIGANLYAGSAGILIKSVGRISTSAGTSSIPRIISTSSGPITFWTTGGTGGVAFGNFTRLDSATSGAGADITIGGGSADANNPNRPAAAASSNSSHGAELGTTINANVFVVRAGTGAFSLSAAYTGTPTTAKAGIWLPPGQNIQAGTIKMSGTTTYNQLDDFTSSIDGYFSSARMASEFHATQSFPSKENAIIITGSSASNTGLALGPNIDDPGRFTIKASGTNAGISITGNSSNASATSGLWIAGLDLQTKNGDVLLDSGNRPIGLSSASRISSYSKLTGETGGNLTIRAPGLHNSAAAFNINTDGNVLFTPPGSSFSGTQTFPTTGSTVTVGSLVVGTDNNSSALTTGAAVTATGEITYSGTGVTNAHNLTSTNGPIRLLSRGTVSINANLSAGSQGILAKSEGRISTGVGSSGSPRTISTSSGPITFWTTGTNGGVTLNNYARLNSNTSGTGGADITIGGGTADANDSTIPGGNAVSGGNSGVILGTQNVDEIVRVSAGTGDVVIRGESTAPSTARSGIDLMAGVKITGATVDLFGKANNPSETDNTAAGIFHYQDSATAKTLIEATKNFGTHAEAISIRGESSNGTYGMMLGNAVSGSTNEAVTFRTTGTNADIKISGSTGAANAYGFMAAGVTFSTATGNLLLDSGDDRVALSRNTTIRQIVFTPVSGQPGGDITVRTKDLNTFSSGSWNIVTAGTLTLEPPTGQSFERPTTFPLASSVINVGNLIVGSADNSAAVTAGVAVSSVGNITFMGSSFDQASGASLTSTGVDGVVRIVADTASLTSTLSSADGIVALEPRTAGRGIQVGGSSTTTLLLTGTQLQTLISAKTLRLGDGTNTGNVVFNSSVNLTGKVQNLAIRSAGNVSGAVGVVITVANLGIDAGGTVNFPGNQAASAIALAGTSISFNQTSDYSVAAVDGIDPEYGLGIKFAVTSAPAATPQDAFMNVAFNPPPVVEVLDKFNNVLESNNLSAAGFTASVTANVLTTSSGTPALADTTPERSGGEFSFDDLNVQGGTGTLTLSFAVTKGTAPNAVSLPYNNADAFTAQAITAFSTGTYNVQAGEPASIALSFTATSAQAGKTGLAPTATLKDVAGNTIDAGPRSTAAITIAISGTDGSIVSGATATTTNGVASFPNLVLGGKVNTNYTLTFSVTFTNTQSQSVTVTEDEVVTLTFGDPAKVTLGAAAQTVANRTNLANIVATVRDAYDNVVTNSTASVALAFSTGANLSQSAVVSGYSAQNATAGVATFSGISLATKADDYTITASSGSLTAATQVVTVTHGTAHSIALTSPANATNDVAFGTQPVVRIYDQELNPVTTGAQAIQTVTLSATGATIGGTVSMPAVAGVADFTGQGVKLTGTIGSITLKAAIASPNAIEDTETVTLGFGSATKLAITQSAAGFVNRTNFTTQPKVTVQDVSGNTVTNFTGAIELSIGSGAAITGTRTLTLVAGDLGVASFTGLGLQGTIGTYTLTASATNLTSATQTGVALTHGAAASVELTIPATVTNDVVFGVQPQARILDADGNLVSTGAQATQDVVLTSSNATIAGTLTQPAVGGVANFTGIKLTSTIGSRSITATIADPSATDTESTTVTFGSATKLAITQAAAGFVNRTNFTTQPKVTVQDVSGNTVTNFTGAIELSIGSGAAITGTRTLTLVAGDLGVASFTGLGLQGTIGTYTLTASATNLTSATQTGVALTHGAAASVELTIPATVTNDVVFGVQPQARILDADGNLVSTGVQATQDVVLTSSNATIAGTLTQPAVGGVANFTGIKLTSTIGSRSITATIADPSATDTESTTVTFGSATKLAITQAAAGFVNRTNFTTQPKVTVQDVSGNTVTNFAGTINVAVSAGATLTGGTAVTISASDLGVASYSDVGIYGPIATYTLTFSSGSLTSATQSAAISHGEAHSLELTVPATATNDVVFGTQPVVRILDEDGNLVSTGSQAIQTVTLSATGAVLDGTLSMPAVGGVANFTGKDLKLTGLIGPKPLKASISSPETIEATSNITLQFGAATQLALTQAASGFVNRTNFTTQPVIEVRDISGNAVTNYSGTVSIGVGSGANVSGTTSVTLTGTQSGLASFSGLGLYGTVGSYTLTYSSGSLTNATQSVSLTHGVATQLSVTTEADGARAGIEFTTQPVVKVLDQDSNVVTTGDASTSNIRVQSSGASLSGTLTALADQGVATFTNLKLSGTIGTYQLSYSALTPALAATFTAKSHDIELAPGVATEIHVTQQPTAVIAGEALSPVVSVQLRDAWQNVVTTDSTSTVKPVLVDASTEAVIDSSVSATAVTNGAISFTGLSFTSAGERKLKFESGAITKLSDSFTITHAAASQIVWTSSQPTAMRNDIAISPAPAFEIQDQFGNPALTGPRFTVVASVTGSNSGDVLSSVGTSQTQASNSAAVSFGALSLRAPAASYQLRFTATNGSTTFSVDSTSAIPLTFGDPTQLFIATQAATAGAGLAFGTQPVVHVLDSAGNLVSDSTLNVTASVSGRDLVGTATIAAASGIANFANSGLGINGAAANGLTLVFSAEYPSGTFFTTSQSINVTAGTATLISMIQQPTTLVTRESFSPAVSVELRDQFGNKVASDSSSTVSVVLYDSTGNPAVATSGQPALTSISTTSSQGVATFTGLSYAVAPGTGYYLRITLNGFTISSGTFTVLPGAATSIEIDVQPSTTVGAGLTPTGELIQVMPEISLYDQDGYLATTTNGTATITATNSGNLSEGATSATVTNGQADFSGIKLVGLPGQNYSLVFAFGSATKTSAAMQVTHNVATKIVLDRGAANGRSHEVFTTQPIVKILDRYNNLVTSGNDSSLDLRVVTSGGSVSGANISAQGGVGTFTGLSLGGAVNTDYTFTYEATFRQDIATATQTGVQVGYGFASQLRIHQEPVSLANGILTKTGDALATQPVIHVTDNWGNIVENSSIQITASLLATQDVRDRLVSATATAVNGVATFNGLAMVVRPEADYKIRFAAGSLTRTSGNVRVRHGDATALRIVTQPSSVTGSGLTMTGEVLATTPVVEAIDFDGNRATSVNGDIATATVSVGNGEAVADLHSGGLQHNQAAFTAGVAAFQNLKVVAIPGVEQKLAFGATIASTAVATPAASAGFTLTNNVAHQLSVLTQPCAGAVASSTCGVGITGDTMLVQPVIEIQDRYGNRVPEFGGEVSISTSTAGSSILVNGVANPTAQKATAVSGVATFSGIGLIALPSAQTQFSFTSPNLLSTSSANVVVAAAAPHKLVMATQPVGGRTGDALATQPVIRVLDRFDNHVLSDNATVVTASIASGTGGTLSSVAGAATAVGGVVTFTDLVFSGVPGANYTLGFGSGSLVVATSANFSVTNGLAAGLNFTSQPVGGKTGDLLSNLVELELLDDELNLAADDNSTVVTVGFAVTDGNARFVNSSDVTVTPSITAVGGVVDFGDLRVVGTPGYEYKLVFTATPTSGPSYNSAHSAGFTLTHANPAQLVVTQSPVGGIVGGALATQPTLRVQDRFGNHATSDNSTTVAVSIYSGASGSIVSGGSATAVGGVVSFGAITASGTPGELYRLRFSATAANSALFSVDDTVGFRLSKTASLTFSYAAVAYAPDAIISPTFATDSPAIPVFTTNSSASVCELVLDPNTSAPNGQIRVKGVGSCVVTVTIPNAPFYSTISATETLVINKAQQAALLVTSANNIDYWSTMTPTASGGSGTGAVSFLVQGDCRIIGTTLIPGNAGSPCEITARKLGDANYQIAYSDPMDITINKIGQTPLRMANANTAAMIDLTLFTSGGSGTGAVTFQITTNRSVAGVEQCVLVDNDTKLRALSSGECGVSATKATSTNHLVAISPEQTVTFTKAQQRVNFTSSIPAMPLVGSIYTPIAVASSGLAVTYTITAGSGTICAWDTDPTKIKFLAAGSCEITATQVGDGQFSQASNTQTIVVNARNQTINFAEIANRTFGQPGFFLQASATSGLPVSFSVGSSAGSPACSITGGSFVNLLSAGSCEIIATQAGNQEYLAATPVKHIFTIAADLAGAPHLISISAGNQTVTASFNPPSYNGGAPITAYRLVATAANGDRFVNPGCPVGTGPISCTLVGVPNSQPGVLNSGIYTLKVAAITVAGIGNYSIDSRAITAAAGDMGVTNLIANPSVSTLTLDWNAPAALDSTFQQYEIYVWPLGEEEPETPTTTSTTTSATFSTGSVVASSVRRSLFAALSGPTSIAPADAYEFKVVTITSQTQQADENLNTTFGMQQSFTRPGQPTQLQLQELPQKLSLGWSIPAFDGGKPILGYTVKVNGEPIAVDGVVRCEAITARICDFPEPRAGMTYEFEVFATNSIGDGAVATYSITMPAPPSSGEYVGPLVTHVMPNPAKPGALVVVVGAMLDIVETISIAGRELEFSIASSNALSVRLPANIAEGLYDLVISSSYGRLTVQDALVISLTAISPEPEIDPETDSGSGSESNNGSEGNSGSESSGNNGSSGSGSTDSGSSGGDSTHSGDGSGSEGNSGSDSDGSSGETAAPVPGDEDQGDLAGGLGLWWIPVVALVLAVIAARRSRAKAATK